MTTEEAYIEDFGRRWWKLPGVPHKGWRYVRCLEHDGVDFECQMCGRKRIRYEHRISHPRFPEVLGVGCCCCENLTRDYGTAKAWEQKLANLKKKRAGRIRRRLALREAWMRVELWHRTKKGGYWRDGPGGIVTVFERDGWKFVCDGKFGHAHPSPEAAMAEAFESLHPEVGP